jgi:6-aminohexanoate-oligomer endohydrolase
MRQVPLRTVLFMAILYFQPPLAMGHSAVLQFDFPELQIGTAENPKGPTGLTLFYFPQGAQAAVDIRGGSVGTFFTQEKMHQGDAYIDGVVFAGGGILGMEAISGVVSSLFEKENAASFTKMPLISGAVIFDYTPRKNRIYPDHTLGKQAFKNLKTGEFPQGQHGVGIAATHNKLLGKSYEMSGQGGAFSQIGQTKIAVFTVVNAVGLIHDGHDLTALKDLHQETTALLQKEKQPYQPGMKNTTLTIVVINEKLAPRHLQQLGRQVHHALSQAIHPYATILDGDVLYTISTRSVESDLYAPNSDINSDVNPKLIYLGMIAGELAKQAVFASTLQTKPDRKY